MLDRYHLGITHKSLRLARLSQVRTIFGNAIFGLGSIIQQWEHWLEKQPQNKPISAKDAAALGKSLKTWANHCSYLSFLVAGEQVARIASQLKKKTALELKTQIANLRERIEDEFKHVIWVEVVKENHHLLKAPLDRWKEVTGSTAFPETTFDIENASACLALGESTASVFHLMRVMESGLRSLALTLQDPRLNPKTNPSWENILHKCDDELKKPHKDRSPEWQQDDVFFSTATANLRAVKDAWRNPTMHVEIHYDEERATEIYLVVRSFMRHLSKRLSSGSSSLKALNP